MLCPGVTAICADGPNSFFFSGWWERGLKKNTERDFKDQHAVSGTHSLHCAHATIHTSSLPPHPHEPSNIKHPHRKKRHLEYLLQGDTSGCCPEYIPPRHPLARTHMNRNIDTQRHPWAHSHGREPPCAASPASALVLAPPCGRIEDRSLRRSGAGRGSGGEMRWGSGTQVLSTSSPSLSHSAHPEMGKV